MARLVTLMSRPAACTRFAQHAGTHGAGTHARIAGNDDVAHRSELGTRLLGRGGLGLGTLHGLHLAGGFTQGIGLVGFRLLGTDEHGGDQEGDGGGGDDGEQHPDQGGFRCHQQHGEDGARRGGGDQACVEQGQGEDPVMPPAITARMRRGSSARRGRDLVDAAEEVDDGGTGSGLLGGSDRTPCRPAARRGPGPGSLRSGRR